MVWSLLRPTRVVHAHCDLPCGVYDPAQARIEAESVMKIQAKYQDAENEKKPTETVDEFKARALNIKEERADLVKHHLWVLWTDYFKPEHLEKYPELHQLFNEATKLAGASGTKGGLDAEHLDKYPELHEKFWNATKVAADSKKSQDPKQGQELLDAIADIDKIFWETKK